MTNAFRLTFFMFLVGLVSFTGTGCARKKQSKVSQLESQVNAITDELVRMDQSIQEIRASIQTQQGGAGTAQFASEGATAGGRASTQVYRTPSGFELPSANIQKALKNAGYYQGGVDGKIGHATKEAVKAFQRDHGLHPDGVVGRRTWDKLKDYVGGTQAAG